MNPAGSGRNEWSEPLPHFEIASFLGAAIALLGLISLCLLVFGRLGVGSIVAFLVAGLITGQVRELPAESVLALREFAEIGVVLLLFLIGLEIKPPQLRALGRDALTLGMPQIIVSAGVIGIYTWWAFAAWSTAVVLGLGFALSSTIVVVQLLRDRNELHTSWGGKAFAVLLAQDLAVVPFLLVVSLMGQSEADGGTGVPWWWAILRGIIVVVGIPAAGRLVLTPILAVAAKQQNEAAFACATFLGVLAAALAAERVGLSMALGTFLLGATLSVSPFGHRIAAAVEPVKSILLALFFLSIGFSIDLQIVSAAWAPLLLNIFVILAIKFGIILMLAFLAGIQKADGLRLSLALTQCGEFGFVLFSAALARGLMSAELSALASVLITISMLATPSLVRFGARSGEAAPSWLQGPDDGPR
jgi:glutathione-regulated potassium-efflux system ancillary protein KefC